MTRTLLFSALLSGLVLAGTAQARQQIILNGSFEDLDPNDPNDVAAWNIAFGGTRVDDFAFDSDWSGLTDKSVGSFTGFAQQTPIEVTGSTRLFMQAYVYNPSSNPLLSNEAAGIKIEFRPAEGFEPPADEENLAFDSNAPLDTWELVTLSTTVPDDIFTAEVVFLSFDNSDDNGFVYVDDVEAIKGSEPGVNQLINESFEFGISAPDGMPGWDEFGTGFSVSRKNNGEVPALDGTFVCRMGGNTTGVIQDVEVEPGESLDISGFFRQRSDEPYSDPNGDAAAGPKVQWDFGGLPPQVDIREGNGNPQSGVSNIIEAGAPTDEWVKVFIDYTLPENAAAALTGTVINGFASAGSVSKVYFDAVEFVLTNVFIGSDSDADGDQDMVDIALLQRVFTGPGGPNVYGGLVFDHDEDDDVDFVDVDNEILPNQTGPAATPQE